MLSDGIPSICSSAQLQVYLYPAGICGGGACEGYIRLVVWTKIHSFSYLALNIMMPTTTPFPVDMPYWNPSWIPMPYPLPSPIPTVTITTVTTIPLPFLNPEPVLGLPSNVNFLPTKIPTTTTGSFLPSAPMIVAPAPFPPAINANAKDGSINYYTANYSQPMLSTVPAPPVALPQCAPPAPSTPTAAAPRKCGNCGTTETYRWRSVTSKESIRCFTCYEYRRTTKKERPAAVIKANQLKKMKRI